MTRDDDVPDMRTDAPPVAAVPTDVVSAARAGQAWAYRELFDEIAGPLRGYAAGRRADDPDGLANDVLAEAFRALDHFEGDAASFRAFCFHIARRRLIDEWRRASRRPRLVLGDLPEPAGVDPGFAVIDTTPAAVALLDVLTDDQRDVILLRVVADLPLAETAQVLDKPVSAVKSLQRRGLERIRRHLDDEAVSSATPPTISES